MDALQTSSHGFVPSGDSEAAMSAAHFRVAQASSGPRAPAESAPQHAPAAAQPAAPGPDAGAVVTVQPTPLGNGVGASAYRLPADVTFDSIRAVDGDLVLQQRNGTSIVLEHAETDGAGGKQVPTLFVGDVEIPREALAAAFEANGIVPAAGPGGGAPTSSGGDFTVAPGDIGDSFGISPLLPPTDLSFSPLTLRTIAPFLANDTGAAALSPLPADLEPPTASPAGVVTLRQDAIDGIGTNPGSPAEKQVAFAEFQAGSAPLTSFALSGTDGLVRDTNGDGAPDLTWVQVSPGLIEGHLGGPAGDLVARITLNAPAGGIAASEQGSASVTLELLAGFPDPAGAGKNVTGLGAVSVVASTAGGQSAFSTITVRGVDDVPLAGDGSRHEHLANGNFEDTAGTNWKKGGDYGPYATVVKAWDLASAGGPNGAAGSQVRLERPHSGFNGIITADGKPYVDLEATPGGIQISQKVQGLEAGKAYILQFDLAAHDVSSTGLEVIWNGKVVGTFVGAQQMKELSLQVTAQDGANTVAFRETGSKDREGSYLHDIHLYDDPRVGAGLEHVIAGDTPKDLVIAIAGVPIVAGADGWRGGQFGSAVDFTQAPTLKVIDSAGLVHDVTWAAGVDASVAGKATLVGQALIGGVLTTVVTVSVLENGSLEYVQSMGLYHPPGGSSDGSMPLQFHYVVTDNDGDSTGQQTATFIVTDDTPLAVADSASVAASLSTAHAVGGNVLANDHAGSDGATLLSIKIDGKTYTYDEAAHHITGGGLLVAGDTLAVKTALGGTLTFHFGDSGSAHAGDYSYGSPTSGAAVGKSESFSYHVVDHDGDTSWAKLTIGVTPDVPAPALMAASADGEDAGSLSLLAALAPAALHDIALGHEVFTGSVSGGSSADVIADLPGSTLLTGGGGADTFRFELSHLDAKDLIADYAPEDRIDLTALLKVSVASAALADAQGATGDSSSALADSISYDKASGVLSVHAGGEPDAPASPVAQVSESASAAAGAAAHPPAITVVYEDAAHVQHTAHLNG